MASRREEPDDRLWHWCRPPGRNLHRSLLRLYPTACRR